MNDSHPIPAVAMLDEHVRQLLRVIDVEYDCDTPNLIPHRVQDYYRMWLVRARGGPAIAAVSAQAGTQIERLIPEAVFEKFDEARAELESFRWKEAQAALEHAERILTAEPLPGLSLQEMAWIACTSSSTTIVAELLGVYMSCDFQDAPADTWALTDDEATVDGAIPILVDAAALCQMSLDDLDATHIRERLRELPAPHHPGLLILLWAVESGAFGGVRAEVAAGLAQRRRDRLELRRVMSHHMAAG